MMMLLKKTVHNTLVTKVNATDTNGFILKTQYNTEKSGLEKKINDASKKISDVSGLVKKNILRSY